MSTDLTTDDDRRGTHPAQIGHLVMGLAFLGLVGIWAAIQSSTVAPDNVRWLLPLPWVFAGAAGLMAAVISGRRSARRPSHPAYPAPAYDANPSDTDLDYDLTEESR